MNNKLLEVVVASSPGVAHAIPLGIAKARAELEAKSENFRLLKIKLESVDLDPVDPGILLYKYSALTEPCDERVMRFRTSNRRQGELRLLRSEERGAASSV